MKFVLFQNILDHKLIIEFNPVMTTSLYEKKTRLYRQMSCDTNYYFTVNQNIIFLGDNKPRLKRHSVITEFDCIANIDTSFELRHPRCVEPELQNGKSTVKTQLYLFL